MEGHFYQVLLTSSSSGKLKGNWLWLISNFKGSYTERTADFKLTLQWHSNRRGATLTPGQEEDIRSRQRAKGMLGLSHMIIYNIFFTSWTFAYKSSVFYHGHNLMLILKDQSNCWVCCQLSMSNTSKLS